MSNSFRRSSHSGTAYIYFSHFLVHALSSLNFFQSLFPFLKLHRSWRNCKFTKQRVFLYQWVSLSAVVVEKGDKVNVSVQFSVLYYNIIIIIVIIIIIIIALRVWLDHINVDSALWNCHINGTHLSLQVTLSRAMAALSIWQKMKLAWHLMMTKDPIRYVLFTCVWLDLKY